MKKIGILAVVVLLSACAKPEKKKEQTLVNEIKNNEVTMKTIHFTSEGLNLVGNLYYPPNFEEDKQYTILICS